MADGTTLALILLFALDIGDPALRSRPAVDWGLSLLIVSSLVVSLRTKTRRQRNSPHTAPPVARAFISGRMSTRPVLPLDRTHRRGHTLHG
jgi:hypothetical protein